MIKIASKKHGYEKLSLRMVLLVILALLVGGVLGFLIGGGISNLGLAGGSLKYQMTSSQSCGYSDCVDSCAETYPEGTPEYNNCIEACARNCLDLR